MRGSPGPLTLTPVSPPSERYILCEQPLTDHVIYSGLLFRNLISIGLTVLLVCSYLMNTFN